MALGNKIQLLREDHNLSQKELANLIGVTTGAVAEWESNESVPSLTELSRLSKALNVSFDVLLDETSEDLSPPVTTLRQKSVPVTAFTKKHVRKDLIIGVAVLCTALIAIVVILWSQRVFTPEPLLFSEDTTKIEAADASIVTIFCYNYDGELAATGSGFVAFDGQTIVTNYHVMASAYTCKISTNQDISYEVSEILRSSKKHDIAILKLAEDTGLQPLTLGDSRTIKKGETVVAIGSPLGIKNSVSTGVLSGRIMEDDMDVLQFTAPISSGSSGGALFNNYGNVIGITYASYVDGQNLNLAIPIELADDLYHSKSIVKNPSAIYTSEHPYITQLSKYQNTPSITIDELLANPAKYNGKTVKVYGYISSFYSYWSEWGNTQVDLCYISSADNVTGNGEYDNEMFDAAQQGSAPWSTASIEWTATSDEKIYLPPNAAPGDKVCFIGTITYESPNEFLSENFNITLPFDITMFSISVDLFYSLES